jgi:hypothetical protein
MQLNRADRHRLTDNTLIRFWLEAVKVAAGRPARQAWRHGLCWAPIDTMYGSLAPPCMAHWPLVCAGLALRLAVIEKSDTVSDYYTS